MHEIDQRLTAGIIPALAGNTDWSHPINPFVRDHPRSRGEYFSIPFLAIFDKGSSPLSRGIPASTGPQLPPVRIIPALAGNTRNPGLPEVGTKDHPRSRGEYLDVIG